jgi:hypothetical protein
MRRRILLVAVMASMALALFTPAAIAQDDDDEDDDGAAPYGTPSRTATATATTPLLRTRTTMITMGGPPLLPEGRCRELVVRLLLRP